MTTRDKIPVLLNPSAGRGKAFKMKPRLEALLRRSDIPSEIIVTRSEDELRALSRTLPERYGTVAGAGGDSTFHIMANEVLKQKADVNLAFIGLGSSNDISREFGTETLEKACRAIKRGETRSVDAGLILSEGKAVTHFLGQANIGLGVEVNRYIEDLAAKRPALARRQALAGALGILHAYWARKIPVSLDIRAEKERLEGRFDLAVFSNIRFWATGREIAPQARTDDGELDGCFFAPTSILKLLYLTIRARKGRHLRARKVSSLRSSWFEVRSPRPFQVQADGEILSSEGRPRLFTGLEFRALHSALRLISDTQMIAG